MEPVFRPHITLSEVIMNKCPKPGTCFQATYLSEVVMNKCPKPGTCFQATYHFERGCNEQVSKTWNLFPGHISLYQRLQWHVSLCQRLPWHISLYKRLWQTTVQNLEPVFRPQLKPHNTNVCFSWCFSDRKKKPSNVPGRLTLGRQHFW